MKRTLSLPLLCLLMLLISSVSCTRNDRKSGAGATGNRPPIVASASIYPARPTANTALAVHFSVEDAEKDAIQCVFRWYVDGALIQDGQDVSLQPGTCRKGSTVYVEVLPSDQYSTGIARRTEEITINNAPPAVVRISLTPKKPGMNDIITAVPEASDPDGDSIRYAYQWLVNGNPVGEAGENNEFRTQGLRKKDTVAVFVTPSDGEDAGPPRPSEILTILNMPPEITSAPPPADVQKGVYLYQVTAKDPDGDDLKYSLGKSPAGMTIDPSTGLITWEPRQVAAREEVVVKIVVSDGDGGSMDQEYSLILAP